MPQERKSEIAGFVGEATLSSGNTMHIPDSVCRHWNLQQGDKLEFYSQYTDIPDELAMNFRLIAVVIRKKDDDVPYGEPFDPGLKKVAVDGKGIHVEGH